VGGRRKEEEEVWDGEMFCILIAALTFAEIIRRAKEMAVCQRL
jgi:hypothetical protein